MSKQKNKTNKFYPGRIKFYADEDVDMRLIRYLRDKHKINIATAIEKGFTSRDDKFHFQEAKRQGRFLLTCDKGYLNHRKFPFNQMLGIVILDIPPKFPGLGYMSLWLEREIVPSGKEIIGVKVVIHADSFDFYFIDDTCKIIKQIVSLTK